MVKLQIVFIIITILLAILALCYKTARNGKFKNIIEKYKLYYVYNILFYSTCLVAILFYKLKIDAIILVLVILYFAYLSFDLISGKDKEENEIYSIMIMFLVITLILIVSIKYILIVEIINK